MECPICLEQINERNEVILKCNHKYCRKCFIKWRIGGKNIEKIYYAVKKGKPYHKKNEEYSMLLSINDYHIKCPLCRKEYTMLNEHYWDDCLNNNFLAPPEILHRVWFKDPKTNKLSICHHITSWNDILDYIPYRDEIANKIGKEISDYAQATLNCFGIEMFEKNKDFHVVKSEFTNGEYPDVAVIPYDICDCDISGHATPDEFYKSLIDYKPSIKRML